jgi:hypothetical protein
MSQNAIKLSHSFPSVSETLIQSVSGTTSVLPEMESIPSFLGLASRLKYLDKVQYTFNIAEDYRNHFALIRGLIDFHRSANIQVKFNREERSFEVRVNLQQVDSLIKFLEQVQEWLSREVKFKTALKQVMQFEALYRSQRAAVYDSLMGIKTR